MNHEWTGEGGNGCGWDCNHSLTRTRFQRQGDPAYEHPEALIGLRPPLPLSIQLSSGRESRECVDLHAGRYCGTVRVGCAFTLRRESSTWPTPTAGEWGPGGGGGFGTRPWWLALLACGGAYWPLALEPSAMTSRHPYYCGHPHCRGHPPAWGGGGNQNATSAHGVLP